eukprot:NODE_3256_length_1388_cov_24.811067_g2832_i0.p1 GENE.NODE_3256_length_1388_cov_24.811067_g2832_i0~~NODE_3256_length_1388_cov_24.811067_g2832_i0.p1  ORF type:complete len:106 (-),score=13.84 NODE_3256_length_1388_cov_24.811067_g2832_i0:1039-1356(-)
MSGIDENSATYDVSDNFSCISSGPSSFESDKKEQHFLPVFSWVNESPRMELPNSLSNDMNPSSSSCETLNNAISPHIKDGNFQQKKRPSCLRLKSIFRRVFKKRK